MKKILIVEDDQKLRNELKIYLEKNGYEALTIEKFDNSIQEILNKNPHKELKNILGEYFPKRFASFISGDFAEFKGHQINGKTRDFILENIHNFSLKITGTNKGEETVTAGGVDLDEINPKTMESKKYKGLYFIGEVLNIDGFCGGFNLQNAWSTAFVAAKNICK